MYYLRLSEIDGNTALSTRVLTGPELASINEVLLRVRGVETTINERKAMRMLRQAVAEALAKS